MILKSTKSGEKGRNESGTEIEIHDGYQGDLGPPADIACVKQ